MLNSAKYIRENNTEKVQKSSLLLSFHYSVISTVSNDHELHVQSEKKLLKMKLNVCLDSP